MATPRQRAADIEPSTPQTAPAAPVMATADYNGFIWQQLSEIQRGLGSIQESQKNLAASLEKLDTKCGSKFSTIEGELGEIKQIRHTAKVVAWIVGIAFAGIFALVSFIANTMWDALKPMTAQFIERTATKPQQSLTPTPAPVPPPALVKP